MTTDSHTDGGWETDDTYYYRRDADESTASAVVRAVGAVSGRSPIASEASDADPLEPLYETVDPGALDALFRDDDAEPVGNVRFEYCDHEVTVDSTGLITVTRR